MNYSITSLELVDLLEKSEIDYMLDRMTAIQERDGNPEGIVINNFGSCVAYYSQSMAWGLFNNVKGTINENQIDEIVQFYNERDRAFEFQIVPGKADNIILRALVDRGFYQSGFHTTLYCPAQSKTIKDAGNMYIRALKEDEFDIYAEIHCLGTGLSIDGKSYVAANNQVLFNREGWRFYIGFVDQKPASVAVMYMKAQIASLTFAATLPEYRNLGLQTHLIQRRINDAALLGCKLIVSQAAFCSQSHRNMEKVGLKVGYTRATWIRK